MHGLNWCVSRTKRPTKNKEKLCCGLTLNSMCVLNFSLFNRNNLTVYMSPAFQILYQIYITYNESYLQINLVVRLETPNSFDIEC